MSAAVLKTNQPIQFGGGNASTPAVTLKFSSQAGSSGGGGGGNTIYRKPGYNAPFRPTNYPADILMGDGPGRRLRKNVANVRRHVDYVSNILNHMETRLWQHGKRQRVIQQPDELYQNTALPAWCTPEVPVDCVLTKFVRAAMNKVKCPVYSLCWTPEGKRLITGASTGEFTLWNGTAFNFETILQAHDSAIRAMTWSYNQQWLISGDHDGYIKYWQPNMNNVHMYQAHKDDPIRGLSFAPTDVKLVSASDDGTARIWDFARCSEERVLRGHGSEVRCVDWHPQKGLIVTGSRDSQQPVKLWDPKAGQCLSTIQDHKSSVMAVKWNTNGNWLLTAGRDHLIKLYDIRIMKEMHTYRGHKKEVTSVAWNPVHENLFVSGGGDGSIAYWLVGTEKEVGLLEHAHDQAIWAMQFHPKGHILSTGSNDNNTKFWARNRPGDTQEDIFGLASFNTNMVGALDKEREPKPANIRIDEEQIIACSAIPGMGLDDDVFENMNRDIAGNATSNTSNMLLIPEDLNSRRDVSNQNNRRVLLKQPPPKKAQRQFERMWNVSKPGAAGDDGSHRDEDPYRRPKGSLLGDPLPSMLGNQHAGMPPSMLNGGRMPAGPPPANWNIHNRAPPQQLSREAFDMPPPMNNERAMPPPFDPFSPPRGPPPMPAGMAGIAGMWPPAPELLPRGMLPPGMELRQPLLPLPPDLQPRMMPPMGPDMVPRMPPGMDMPGRGGMQESPNRMPPRMEERNDDRGRDIDYRSGPPPSSAMGIDVDLRAPPPMDARMQGPPSSENWRSEQGPSNPPPMNDPRAANMNDPRLRRQQQEEVRDPRRRQSQQQDNGNRGPPPQEERQPWMPNMGGGGQQRIVDGNDFGMQQDFRRNEGPPPNFRRDEYDNRGGNMNRDDFGGPMGNFSGRGRGRGRGRPY